MTWKVYDIALKKYEPFLFYDRDGKFTNICNKKYPRPQNGTSIWRKDNTFGKINNPNRYIESLIIPTWLTETKYIKEAFLSQIPAYVDLYYRNESFVKNDSLFLIYKIWDDYTEIGMALYHGTSNKRNRSVEKLIKRLDNLVVFS